VEANITPSNPLIQTFIGDHAAEKWRKCCIKAAECCREMIEVGGITNGKYSSQCLVSEKFTRSPQLHMKPHGYMSAYGVGNFVLLE
jgi:hypothetical protein